MICWRLPLRVNALDRQAADTGARERGQRHRVACFHEIDPRWGAGRFDRKTSRKLFGRRWGSNRLAGTYSITFVGARAGTNFDGNTRLRQSSLRQHFDDALKISGVLIRQDAFESRQREIRSNYVKLSA